MPYRYWTLEMSGVMWWFKSLPGPSHFSPDSAIVLRINYSPVIIVQILITCLFPPCDCVPNSNYLRFGIYK